MIRGKTAWYMSAVLGVVLILLVFGGNVGAQQEAQVSPISLVSSHDLEFYMNPLLVDFVRPGLTVQLENPTIGSDRRLRVNVRISDNVGLPLDRNGVFSPGPVSLSFIAAHLPSENSTYVAYTTRQATSSITGTDCDSRRHGFGWDLYPAGRWALPIQLRDNSSCRLSGIGDTRDRRLCYP